MENYNQEDSVFVPSKKHDSGTKHADSELRLTTRKVSDYHPQSESRRSFALNDDDFKFLFPKEESDESKNHSNSKLTIFHSSRKGTCYKRLSEMDNFILGNSQHHSSSSSRKHQQLNPGLNFNDSKQFDDENDSISEIESQDFDAHQFSRRNSSSTRQTQTQLQQSATSNTKSIFNQMQFENARSFAKKKEAEKIEDDDLTGTRGRPPRHRSRTRKTKIDHTRLDFSKTKKCMLNFGERN